MNWSNQTPTSTPPIEPSSAGRPRLMNFSYFESDLNRISSNNSAEGSDKFQVDNYLWMYISPIIIVLGICGNTLTLLVMRRRRLRGTTTSIYMPAMAAADTVALIAGIIPEWMEASDYPLFNQLSPVTCRLEKFTFYSSSDTAIWILVVFTLDRFIAVCFPLKKRLICQPVRSKMACVAAVLLAFVKNGHVFWTRGAVYNDQGESISNCDRVDEYIYFERFVRPWLAFCVVSVLPFITLSICNMLIISQILKMSRARSGNSRREKTIAQTSMMCLSVSFAFLICVTPSMVVHIGKPYWDSGGNYHYDVAKTISNLLSYLNHAINFFLYCMTGAKFRRELILLFVGRYGIRLGLEEFSTSHTTTYITNGRRYTNPSIQVRYIPARHDVTFALNDVSEQVLSTVSVQLKNYHQTETEIKEDSILI